MTGFGAGRGEAGGETVPVALRAVNAKLCEVKARLPREPIALEAQRGTAIEALDGMRRREGEALAQDLAARLDTVEKGAREVSRLAPLQVDAVRERLSARIAELTRGVPLDPSRLAQEVALFADRTDVAEELTRLASHLAQARGLIRSEAPAGRKLEFLVQELNREINTI